MKSYSEYQAWVLEKTNRCYATLSILKSGYYKPILYGALFSLYRISRKEDLVEEFNDITEQYRSGLL